MALLVLYLVLLEPSTAAEWKALGMKSIAAQELQAALPAFEKACDLDPKDEDTCYYYARTLFSLDRWDEARGAFDKALRAASKPRLARVHRAMALNFMALGNTGEADRQFQRAVAVNPGPGILREDPRVDYGAFLFRQGRLDEALPLLQQAVQAIPESARAHTELGRLWLHMGKLDAAAASLEKAVTLDPKSSAARLQLGRTYIQMGRVDEGQKQLQLAGSSTLK